ncbi:hypothetical protein KXD93_10750 [Mucilaginibacter sp. BJC16-A38]|uniref:hypothetical protein n=1 Tax=Mucilaginibacter phenanthrenivorans TaxID=1234842 RepID=UPI0021571D17|nr:hypothetical protein [Mucilaginibacter phenanthrenivorans]MCR8558126.1 hypothetical protein [Mucilaginibacter phenanthrenivorans]
MKKHTDPGQGTTIPVSLARERVTRWLKTIGAMPEFKKNHESIPRAIFISFDDIKQLEAAYPPDTLKGIRMYFGLAGEDEPIIDPTVTELRGMVVPVLKTDDHRHHKDLIKSDPTNPNDTSIYDFTAPCPVYCDKQSELYVPFLTEEFDLKP